MVHTNSMYTKLSDVEQHIYRKWLQSSENITKSTNTDQKLETEIHNQTMQTTTQQDTIRNPENSQEIIAEQTNLHHEAIQNSRLWTQSLESSRQELETRIRELQSITLALQITIRDLQVIIQQLQAVNYNCTSCTML